MAWHGMAWHGMRCRGHVLSAGDGSARCTSGRPAEPARPFHCLGVPGGGGWRQGRSARVPPCCADRPGERNKMPEAPPSAGCALLVALAVCTALSKTRCCAACSLCPQDWSTSECADGRAAPGGGVALRTWPGGGVNTEQVGKHAACVPAQLPSAAGSLTALQLPCWLVGCSRPVFPCMQPHASCMMCHAPCQPLPAAARPHLRRCTATSAWATLRGATGRAPQMPRSALAAPD